MPDPFSRNPVLEEIYVRFLKTEHSADFIHAVTEHYHTPALERLARHGRRMTRRAATLALGFIGDLTQNSTLGPALNDNDRGVRLLADHGIRQLWFRTGKAGIDSILNRLVRENRHHRFATVIELATATIERDPGTAEAYNQRAIACYNLEDYDQAVLDCRRSIELNPWHFLAALGSANCHLETGDVVEALEDYRLALRINPDLDTVRSRIDQLQKIVEGR